MCVWDGIVFLSPVQPNLRDYGCILENQGSVYKRDKSVFSPPNLRDYGCILENQGSVYKRDESVFSALNLYMSI